MKVRTVFAIAVLAASAATWARAANTQARPDLTRQGHQAIQAMAAASTWGHPDLAGQFAGMQAYAQGSYKNAIKHFKYAARYADKLSQLSIGLLYLNGRGVKKDPVTAWSWLALAAERDYPSFVTTRDRVWKQLDPDQRTRARAIRDTLAKTYGDKVAKVRMRRALQYWSTQITGSRTGFNSGVLHANKSILEGNPGAHGSADAACGRKSIIGAPVSGCAGNFYAKWRWDPKTYFAVKNARWNATVSVGDLQEKDNGQSAAKSDDNEK